MTKFLPLFLLTILFISCQTPPEGVTEPTATAVPPIATLLPSTETAVASPPQPITEEIIIQDNNQPRLELADYPPSSTPYRIEDGDFWLVHTPDGKLMAFIPIAPTYAPHISIDECRYSWTPANQRFEDPCSGDKWELDGQLNVEASSELWSSRNLDQYGLVVHDEAIFVQPHQIIEGVAIDQVLTVVDEQYGIRITADSASFSPTATTIDLQIFIDPIWQINPNAVPPQQALIYPVFPGSLVDEQGRESQPSGSRALGSVFESSNGSVVQRSQMTWEGVADDANRAVASLNVHLDNLRRETSFPLEWFDHQVGDKWATTIFLQLGYATVKITEIEWVETLPDGTAQLQLTVVDASGAAVRLYCLALDVSLAPQPSCPNFEREVTFTVAAPPNEDVSLQMGVSVELQRPFRLHFSLEEETAVLENCPITQTTPPVQPPPSNITVVYTGPDGIYRWQEATGKTELILATQDEIKGVQLSDDGQKIAFVQVSDPQAERLTLGVFDITAQNAPFTFLTSDVLHALHNANALQVVRPLQVTWVPNSHQIAFSTIRHNLLNGFPEGLSSQRYDDLHLLDSESGEVQTLLAAGEGGSFTYSPNGQHIAIVSDNSLSLLDSSGDIYHPHILRWPALGISHEYHRPQAAWLPDSSGLLIAVSNAQDNIDAAYNPDASSTIWRVPLGLRPQELTTMIGAPLWLTYSPDRSQVAFVRTKAEEPADDLHIAAIDNAWNEVYATSRGLNIGGWLPDSSGLLYRISLEAPQIGRLCQSPTRLPLPHTPDSFVRNIKWIDTHRFLFTVDDPPQLFLGALDGNVTLIGSLRDEYFFSVGSLHAFDSK